MATWMLALACGSSPESTDPGGGLERELDPSEIRSDAAWEPCGFGIECRELEVPIDHAQPQGEKLALALARAPHWEGYDYRGAILVNPGGPGGLGRPFDWTLLERINPGVPFMLSGGLDARNLAEAVRVARPTAVDVSSGVERAPGEKDIEKIRTFIVAARDADAALSGQTARRA